MPQRLAIKFAFILSPTHIDCLGVGLTCGSWLHSEDWFEMYCLIVKDSVDITDHASSIHVSVRSWNNNSLCILWMNADDARLRGACCTRRKAESHSLYSRPPPQPPSLQIPDDQGGVNSNKAAASSKPNTYRSTPKARVKGNPFLRRVPGLNYTQDKPFSTPDPVLSVPQPLPSHFALSPHYLRNGNLTWLTVPPPPPLPPPNDARWSAPPLLAMAQWGAMFNIEVCNTCQMPFWPSKKFKFFWALRKNVLCIVSTNHSEGLSKKCM